MASSTVMCRASQRVLATCSRTPVAHVRQIGLKRMAMAPKDEISFRSHGASTMVSRRMHAVTAMATGSDAGLKIDLRGRSTETAILIDSPYTIQCICLYR